MQVQLKESYADRVAKCLWPNAEHLIKRVVLGCVVFHFTPVLGHQLASSSSNAPIEPDAVEVSATHTIVLRSTTDVVLHIIMIYEGSGRKKDKVKRSVESLMHSRSSPTLHIDMSDAATSVSTDTFGPTLKFLVNKLVWSTFEYVLRLVQEPSSRYMCCWPAGLDT